MKKNLLKTLAFMSLACTVAFTTITPAFATEAETTKLDEIEETTELEPSAQSIDTENELEEVVKTWVAKNPEYEKEVELTSPVYTVYYPGRKERARDAAYKIFIAKCKGRYVAYTTAKEVKKFAPYWEENDDVTILSFIIPHNGYYEVDFDEEGYLFYEPENISYRISKEYREP